MTNELFALDLGNKQTKLQDEKGTYVAPSSLLNERELESFFSNGKLKDLDLYQISAEEEKYFWGKGVLRYTQDQLTDTLGFEGRYNRAEYKRLAALSLAKLAKEYPQAKDGILKVDVVAGLPTGDYTMENIKAVINTLKRQYLVQVNNEPINVRVENVEILPQPIGTLYDLLLDDHGYLKQNDIENKRFAVADIGGGTVLLDQIISEENGFRFDTSNRTQSEAGANELYTRIAQKLNSKYGINSDIHLIEVSVRQGIKSKKFSYRQSSNNIIDMTEIVDAEIQYYSQRLVEMINSSFKNLSSVDELVLTGGGASIINQRLLDDQITNTKIRITDNPELANVHGFYKYGLSQRLAKEG